MALSERLAAAGAVGALLLGASVTVAQIPPSAEDIERYRGLHAAAARDDAAEISRLLLAGANAEARDGNGRTALHVAVFTARAAAARALVAGGAQANALDGQRYDIVTIAAVRNDVAMLRLALTLGASPRNVTSPYQGTALIAAAHLGHDEVVRELIRAGAPLDHINNLGWTALLEAVILGDGGPRHVAVLRDLVRAGANPALADQQGVSALEHARKRGYTEMVAILDSAGRR
ncbi:MAG TPA: ankyrin repeat domain-containing protein [Candidatus Nitrosocosmicus sp.]|jgi:ankyrin repeat protein|nr:ankyrin repeat domain-containing protein [Candidatus Nitrosocosmicus sp.]